MDLGSNIAQLRERHGLSQASLAKDLHISQASLAMYETNKRKPNVEMLDTIADYFNVSTDYLLGRKKTKDSSEEQETKDLKKFLEDNLDNGMTFGDGKVTQEDREKLEIALTQIFYRYHDDFKKRKNEKGEFKF